MRGLHRLTHRERKHGLTQAKQPMRLMQRQLHVIVVTKFMTQFTRIHSDKLTLRVKFKRYFIHLLNEFL